MTYPGVPQGPAERPDDGKSRSAGWPESQPPDRPAMPALGAPPPAQAQPAPAPVPEPQVRPALPRPAVEPAPAAPAVGTDATTRLTGGRPTTATGESGTQREAGATLLLGAAGQTTGTAGQSSAAEQAASTAVAASQSAATTTDATGTQATGTVYSVGSGPRGDFASEQMYRVRPLPALRIGSHLASNEALDEIDFSIPGVGLLLGHDRDRKPVQARLFRPEPTRITLVGGAWASWLLAFRALGLGARVVVFTTRPEQWNGFGQWATGRTDRMAVLPAERPVTVQASPRMPVLLIYDVGLLGATSRPNLGPWQTQLTVLHQLTAYGFPAVQESNLVMLQRLSEEEAVSVGSVLRLAPQSTQLLRALRDDMFALVGGGADRYVWLNPTGIEQQRFGAPRR